jgi:SnoaL-like domain
MDNAERTPLELTVQWLKDTEIIKSVPQRYAYGLDTRDFPSSRAMFRDDCYVEGSINAAPIDQYWEPLVGGVMKYQATMHFMGNQLVKLEEGADEGFVETYAVAYHMEADGSPYPDLIMGVRYQDTVARNGADWIIIKRRAIPQWVRGPLPRPE